VTGSRSVAGPEIAGYVLAGGASSRFGRDKALALLDGKTLLTRMCELLRGAIGNERVVAASANYEGHDAAIVPDQWPGEGPLGGIITALEDAQQQNPAVTHCLIVSCDMPFLNAGWLAYLCAQAAASPAQITVPRSDHGVEPLCACWRVSAATPLRQLFEGGTRKVTEVFKHLDTEILDAAHWKRFDSAGRLFWNMNTPQDYESALAALAQERK
jgi:molybdopterin-guanine dinucleotide biosynthesis protein A